MPGEADCPACAPQEMKMAKKKSTPEPSSDERTGPQPADNPLWSYYEKFEGGAQADNGSSSDPNVGFPEDFYYSVDDLFDMS